MEKIKIPNPFEDWSDKDFKDNSVEAQGAHHHESVLSFLKDNYDIEGYSYEELSDNYIVSFEFHEGEIFDGDLFFYPELFESFKEDNMIRFEKRKKEVLEQLKNKVAAFKAKKERTNS